MTDNKELIKNIQQLIDSLTHIRLIGSYCNLRRVLESIDKIEELINE